jgi:hypothetical protein
LRIDPVVHQASKRIDNHVLDSVHVFAFDPFQTHGKERLTQAGKPRTGEVLSQPGIDQGFAQRGSRSADQRMLQDVERQRFFNIGRIGQEPVDRHHMFVGAVWTGGIWNLKASRFAEWRLQRDCRVDRDTLERRQHALQQAQALFRIIIAVEEDQGVGRMVVALMKRPELFVGQVWNNRRIAARVDAVDMTGEQRPLHCNIEHAVG